MLFRSTIVALELGTPFSSWWVKIPVAIGSVFLLLVTVDAIVRIWRSAFAWLPVDRGRGLFRFVWAGVLAACLLGILAFAWVVLTA